MSLFKRGKWYWMDDVVNGVRYRLPLKTTNWQAARNLEKEKVKEILQGKLGGGKGARQSFEEAVEAYIRERKLHSAEKTRLTDEERCRPLKKFFRDTPLRKITGETILEYQTQRKSAGVSGRTINMEVGLLRRVMKKFKEWARIVDDIKMLPERPKPAQVMTPEEKRRLVELAVSKPEWGNACSAAVLALNTTMRGCEIKGLQWQQVDLFQRLLTVRRQSTKTDAGERVIPLNQAALSVLVKLRKEAELLGKTRPEHYVFAACENGKIDPTNPMRSWRSAWRSLRKKAGLNALRFHDLRHQAITEMCEKGLPDMTIMEIAGHVSRQMLKHYSHIRTQAKRIAVESLDTPLPDSLQTIQDGESQAVN